MLTGELGLKEVSEYIENRMLNFWYKVATGDENKISTILYKWLVSLYNQNIYKSPWLDKVKTSLNHMGESYLFDEIGNLPGPIWFKNKIKSRLSDIYKQRWSAEVNSNSVCLNYRIMTDQKKLQIYFKLPRQYIYAICKFKCANSKIPSIIGRYSNKPLEDRACTVCESDEIGDEFHYLFKCSNFNDERIKHIKPYYYNYPDEHKMISLFNVSSKKQMLNLAKFICVILQEFKK